MIRLWHVLTLPFRRGPRRPLSASRPTMAAPSREVPLGMEALDMTGVKAVNRRNDALERVSNVFTAGRSTGIMGLNNAATHVEPMPDDATYAQTYHAAFNRRKTKKT